MDGTVDRVVGMMRCLNFLCRGAMYRDDERGFVCINCGRAAVAPKVVEPKVERDSKHSRGSRL
jgi:hypothetical protein